jgi:IclR family KDG regulon transcriptional repressor
MKILFVFPGTSESIALQWHLKRAGSLPLRQITQEVSTSASPLFSADIVLICVLSEFRKLIRMIPIMPENKTQIYKTLKDLARIVSLFENPEIEERSVSEISKLVEMLPSKVSRMIRTLETEGFFERNSDTGKYRLGIQFFKLGIAYHYQSPLRRTVRPHLELMAKETGLTSSFAVLKGSSVIIIDRVQNLNIDLMLIRLASNVPIHATGLGRVLLAYLSEREQDKVLQSAELKKLTSRTIVDRRLLKENLQLTKKMGYGVDLGETHQDLHSIAAPVRNNHGEVIGAISLTGERLLLPEEKVALFASYLKEKALFISRQLGYIMEVEDVFEGQTGIQSKKL